MIRAEILTKWQGTGTMNDPMRPVLPAGITMSDTTGTAQPVAGQSVIVQVECADLSAVNGYIVLWNEVIENAVI